MKPLPTYLLIISLTIAPLHLRTLITPQTLASHPERQLSDYVLIHCKKFMDKIKSFRIKMERMLGTIGANKRDAFDKLDRAIGRLDLGSGKQRDIEHAINEHANAEDDDDDKGDDKMMLRSLRSLRFNKVV